MLRHYYINKEWVVSARARRIYRVAACLSLMLFFLLVFLRAELYVGKFPDVLVPAAKLLIFAGVVGAATTMVAMEYFLFGFDGSPAWKKALWFCVILFPPVGPPLYRFAVYLRSDVLKDKVSKRVQEASTVAGGL